MITIEPVTLSDREEYIAMATTFYQTDAVDHPLPLSFIERTFEELMRSDDYAVAYLLKLDGRTVGYALLAKTFSQEAGGKVLWVEELFVKEAYRARGIGRQFLSELIRRKPADVTRLRLETERSNTRAVALYESLGFTFLPYDQMILGQ